MDIMGSSSRQRELFDSEVEVQMPDRPTAWLVSPPTRDGIDLAQAEGAFIGMVWQVYPSVIWGYDEHGAFISSFLHLGWYPRRPDIGSFAFQMGMLYWNSRPTWVLQDIARGAKNIGVRTATALWKSTNSEASSPTEAMALAGFEAHADVNDLRKRKVVFEGKPAPAVPEWARGKGVVAVPAGGMVGLCPSRA